MHQRRPITNRPKKKYAPPGLATSKKITKRTAPMVFSIWRTDPIFSNSVP